MEFSCPHLPHPQIPSASGKLEGREEGGGMGGGGGEGRSQELSSNVYHYTTHIVCNTHRLYDRHCRILLLMYGSVADPSTAL